MTYLQKINSLMSCFHYTCKVSHILEAPVENLELSFTEIGLSFELVEALWPMAHNGHLQVIVGSV